MSYYEFFGLQQEPFSTSPDPGFFWLSGSHRATFYRLQVAIKLKRGMSVVLGDVGTGKTTLSRLLFQALDKPQVKFHPIFTPFSGTQSQFLNLLLQTLALNVSTRDSGFVVSALATIERYLVKHALEEGQTVVLLIDEAQKLTTEALEVIRALLNCESHQEKLLQVVLMGQAELLPKLTRAKNLWDRVSLKQVLRPLTVIETEKLIQFRLERAGWHGREPLFAPPACQLIYDISRGYPRQITRLAHDGLERAFMKGVQRVDRSVIEELVEEERSFFEGASAAIRAVAASPGTETWETPPAADDGNGREAASGAVPLAGQEG